MKLFTLDGDAFVPKSLLCLEGYTRQTFFADLIAGVEVRSECFDGMVHGFFRWRGGVDAAHEAMEEGAAALRAALGSDRLSPLPSPT